MRVFVLLFSEECFPKGLLDFKEILSREQANTNADEVKHVFRKFLLSYLVLMIRYLSCVNLLL